MRLDRLATLALSRSLLASPPVNRSAAIAVLMYHNVSHKCEPGVKPYYRLVTSPARFRRQMCFLRDSGYRVIDLAQALTHHTATEGTQPRVVLTFDDGYRDFLTDAWPVLQHLGFAATVFLPTAFISSTTPGRFRNEECLTWSDVRELSRAGVSFGSHSVNHPVLHGLPWQRVRRELCESRQQIEEELGVQIRAFAYPFAFPQEDVAFCERLRRELSENEYDLAVTTVVGRFGSEVDALQIKRLPINDGDDEVFFDAKLNGGYDWVGHVQSTWRRLTRLRRW